MRPHFEPDPRLDEDTRLRDSIRNMLRDVTRMDPLHPPDGLPSGVPRSFKPSAAPALIIAVILLGALGLALLANIGAARGNTASVAILQPTAFPTNTPYAPYISAPIAPPVAIESPTPIPTDTPIPTATPVPPTPTPRPLPMPTANVPESLTALSLCWWAEVPCNAPYTTVVYTTYTWQVYPQVVRQDTCLVLHFNVSGMVGNGIVGQILQFTYNRTDSQATWQKWSIPGYADLQSESDGVTWCKLYVAYSDGGTAVWANG